MDLSSERNAAKLQNFSGAINVPKLNWQLYTSRVPRGMMICPVLCSIFHKRPRWWDAIYPHQAGGWKLNWKADTFEGINAIQTKISSWNVESKRTALCVAKMNVEEIHSKQLNRLGSGCLGQLCWSGPGHPGGHQSEQNMFWTALAREQVVDQGMCLFQHPQYLLGYTRTMVSSSAPSGSGKILKTGKDPMESYWDD